VLAPVIEVGSIALADALDGRREQQPLDDRERDRPQQRGVRGGIVAAGFVRMDGYHQAVVVDLTFPVEPAVIGDQPRPDAAAERDPGLLIG
jgi:hypothetical protein